MLIIINEVGTHTELTNVQSNKIKTEITEGGVDINPKHQNSFSSKNIANFIFVSNESEPLKIEIDDRRFLVLEVNGEKKDNIEYFNELYESYGAKGFYENLLTLSFSTIYILLFHFYMSNAWKNIRSFPSSAQIFCKNSTEPYF